MNENPVRADEIYQSGAQTANIKTHHDARETNTKARKDGGENRLVSASAKRRERIRQLEARLERERSRESETSRKERNGQLFVWGAMVEGVYRNGNDQERELIRQWASKHLTDKRHIQRVEIGFARIEEERRTTGE